MRLPLICLLALLFALPCSLPAAARTADEAPPPSRAPRTPVAEQKLDAPKKIAPGEVLSGEAMVLDGEKLQLQGEEVRLFGVVAPQLTAPYGPQARQTLDQLTRGKVVSCPVRDRDREGRWLAVCSTIDQPDLGLALLEKGLAVAARGSLRNTDFEKVYALAETQAQNRLSGVWAVMPPTTTNQQQAATMLASPTGPVANLAPITLPLAAPVTATTTEPKLAAPSTSAAPATTTPNNLPPLAWGMLGLGLLAMLGHYGWQEWLRRQTLRQSRQQLAAALYGELLAARAILLTRAEQLLTSKTALPWPRTRALVLQAVLPQIGLLGAELARKITTLYGQLSDYAAYYGHQSGSEHGRPDPRGMRQVLNNQLQHLDGLLAQLQQVEATGHLPPSAAPQPAIAENEEAAAPTEPPPATTDDAANEEETLLAFQDASEHTAASTSPHGRASTTPIQWRTRPTRQ